MENIRLKFLIKRAETLGWTYFEEWDDDCTSDALWTASPLKAHKFSTHSEAMTFVNARHEPYAPGEIGQRKLDDGLYIIESIFEFKEE